MAAIPKDLGSRLTEITCSVDDHSPPSQVVTMQVLVLIALALGTLWSPPPAHWRYRCSPPPGRAAVLEHAVDPGNDLHQVVAHHQFVT